MDRTVIISVWLDETSDRHGWIVDTDIASGGESKTLKVFKPTVAGFGKATEFAYMEALRRNCPLRIDSNKD